MAYVSFLCPNKCKTMHFEKISATGTNPTETAQYLAEMGKEGVKYATVQTGEGGLLGILLPDGTMFAFGPN